MKITYSKVNLPSRRQRKAAHPYVWEVGKSGLVINFLSIDKLNNVIIVSALINAAVEQCGTGC